MMWSQLRARIEERLADTLKGRVEIWSTQYRRAVYKGKGLRIKVDGTTYVNAGCISYEIFRHTAAHKLDGTRVIDDARRRDDSEDVEALAQRHGVFDPCRVRRSMFNYLNLPFERALQSTDPIVRSLAMLDGRLGKRRLARVHIANAHPLVIDMYRIRCQAEGITLRRRIAGSD
jgi:hypothetical protein